MKPKFDRVLLKLSGEALRGVKDTATTISAKVLKRLASEIKEIHARIPNTHLVMHGSSSVPQEWLKIINDYGGDMGQTYGVPVEEITEGIKHGVRKVNIDTDLRMASTGSVRKHLQDNPSNFDPRKFLKESTKGMMEICKARYEAFGSAGQADKIKVISLGRMVMDYAAGKLDSVVK